jgi:hypothetical protein
MLVWPFAAAKWRGIEPEEQTIGRKYLMRLAALVVREMTKMKAQM